MANKENNERETHFFVDNFNEGVSEEHNTEAADYMSENSNQCDTDDEGNRRTHPQPSFISQQWPQTYRYESYFTIYVSFFLHRTYFTSYVPPCFYMSTKFCYLRLFWHERADVGLSFCYSLN